METYCKKLGGIICPNCTYDISQRLSKTEGIGSVKTSYIKSEITAEYDSEKISEQEIDDLLGNMGFPAGKGRSNLLTDFIGLLVIAALYFILTYLTGVVNVPAASEGMTMKLVFITGLLGGIHCIGMCGGIMLTQHNALAYNEGRLIGYSVVGFIFGAIGSYISFSLNMKCAVFIIAGGLVVLIGLQMWGSAASPKVSPGTYIALWLQRNTVYNRFTHGCYALRNAVINVVRCSLRRHLIKGRGNHVHLRTGNLRVYAPVRTYKRCVHEKV